MTIEWYLLIVLTHLIAIGMGYIGGKTWMDKRFNRVLPKELPPPKKGA